MLPCCSTCTHIGHHPACTLQRTMLLHFAQGAIKYVMHIGVDRLQPRLRNASMLQHMHTHRAPCSMHAAAHHALALCTGSDQTCHAHCCRVSRNMQSAVQNDAAFAARHIGNLSHGLLHIHVSFTVKGEHAINTCDANKAKFTVCRRCMREAIAQERTKSWSSYVPPHSYMENEMCYHAELA